MATRRLQRIVNKFTPKRKFAKGKSCASSDDFRCGKGKNAILGSTRIPEDAGCPDVFLHTATEFDHITNLGVMNFSLTSEVAECQSLIMTVAIGGDATPPIIVDDTGDTWVRSSATNEGVSIVDLLTIYTCDEPTVNAVSSRNLTLTFGTNVNAVIAVSVYSRTINAAGNEEGGSNGSAALVSAVPFNTNFKYPHAYTGYIWDGVTIPDVGSYTDDLMESPPYYTGGFLNIAATFLSTGWPTLFPTSPKSELTLSGAANNSTVQLGLGVKFS